ncbi:MAG: UDP-2,3-diacylglucosamine diphosphatase [Candidatus Kapabacteria bacterium]|nr:UDP-2,3-diacylglucosamine diphosphatase [Candidatus Kapabacteria bacterium]
MHSDAKTDIALGELDEVELPVEPSERELVDAHLAVPLDVDTIIVSDLHLGSEVARSRALVMMLKTHSYKRLILNGDVFDDLNFKRLTKDDWKVLSLLRRLSNPRRGIEVLWIVGNHDGGVAEILTHLLGVPVQEEIVFTVGGRRHLAIHGHQFDRWITKHVTITAIASALYLMLQRIDPKHRVSRWVKRTSKKWLRLSDKIGHDAIQHGRRKHQADVVHCGHTHMPVIRQIDGATYVNSGCWTDKPSTYVTIDHQGDVQLHSM